MASVWSTTKASGLPLHIDLPPADELPWTISYVIRKRAQLDSFNELPKEKRPPDSMIWYGDNRDIDNWFDKVFKSDRRPDEILLDISDEEIE
jgi:hypothetical protein